MSIHTSLVHYSLITIDVGNLWDALAGALRGRDDAIVSVGEYAQELSNLMQSPGGNEALYVSVGTGDFLTPWLTRLYSEPITGLAKPRARVNRLVIKHIDFDAAEAYEAVGVLETGFVAKLRLNLQTLRTDSDLAAHGVSVHTSTWPQLPLFHGYVFGDQFLIESWRVGSGGYLHVRTPLWKGSRRELPNVFDFVLSHFEAA